jgi:hypothetical protein
MYENRTKKPVASVFRRGGGDEGSHKGDEFDWGMLYACMKISQ